MYGSYGLYSGLDSDEILQQILSGDFSIWDLLNSLGGYIPGIRTLISILTIIFLISAIISFAQCFFGYRLFRIFAAIQGFCIGAVLLGAIGAATDNGIVTFILLLAGGVGGAILAYRVYQIGVFITTGGYIGMLCMLVAVFSMLLSQDSNGAVIAIAFLVGFVLGGVLGVLFARPLIIISTGLQGFNAVSMLVTALHQNTNAVTWVIGLVCTAAGIYYQFRCNPPGTLPGPRSRKWEEKAAQGRQRGVQGFAGAATAATGAASSATSSLSQRLKDLEISKETEEMCDSAAAYLKGNKIAAPLLPYAHIILYVVTVILVLTDSATMFVIPLLLCLLCFASQRFEAIFISLTLLLLRALPYDLDLLSYGMSQISTWVYFCGVAVIVYLDVISLMAFLKTERGKKLVGRANDQAAAANQRQQEYAARQAQQQAYQQENYQQTPPVPPQYSQPSQPEFRQTEPVPPVQPDYQEPASVPTQEPPAPEEPVTENTVWYTEPAESVETPVQSYGTFTEEPPAPSDPPQPQETVPDATMQVPVDAFMKQDEFGSVPQQASADIQDMIDPPPQPVRPINPDYIFCTRCGNRMSRSDNFCIKCGARLEK